MRRAVPLLNTVRTTCVRILDDASPSADGMSSRMRALSASGTSPLAPCPGQDRSQWRSITMRVKMVPMY